MTVPRELWPSGLPRTVTDRQFPARLSSLRTKRPLAKKRPTIKHGRRQCTGYGNRWYKY